MNAADFAAMSDPERNPKFSRRWEEVAGARDFRGTAAAGIPVAETESSLDALAVLVSEDWRSARVVRGSHTPGNVG